MAKDILFVIALRIFSFQDEHKFCLPFFCKYLQILRNQIVDIKFVHMIDFKTKF